jgi:trans-aconitate methyltransferase
LSSDEDPAKGLLKLVAYQTLAQFWTNLALKDEIWEDDAKDLLLLQKALIDETEATLSPHLDNISMQRFRDYVDRYRARIIFSEGAKAKRFHPK